MFTKILGLLTLIFLMGCSESDVSILDARTTVHTTMKGCHIGRTAKLLVDVKSETLPDGRVRCTITTVRRGPLPTDIPQEVPRTGKLL
jgi:hypothetical protein